MRSDLLSLWGRPSSCCCPGRDFCGSQPHQNPSRKRACGWKARVTFSRSAAFGPSTAADKKRGAAQREAARFAAEAAYRQRTAETLDWLGSARIALQVTGGSFGLRKNLREERAVA